MATDTSLPVTKQDPLPRPESGKPGADGASKAHPKKKPGKRKK